MIIIENIEVLLILSLSLAQFKLGPIEANKIFGMMIGMKILEKYPEPIVIDLSVRY